MSSNHNRIILQKYLEECIQCGICLDECTLLNDLGMSAAEIAQAIIEDRVDDRLLNAIQCCDLCAKCSQSCQSDLNPAELFRTAREMLIQNGRIPAGDYDVMLVDQEWNFFSIYRATYDIHYDDLIDEEFDALFFPGCTLSSYSPELTRAAFDWLQTHQPGVTGFSDLCCGKPLDSIGLPEQADSYLNHLRERLSKAGCKKILTACSNCAAHLRDQLSGVKIQSIYELMRQAGIRLSGSEKLTFHDSCPDRFHPQTPADVRSLLSGYTQVEMASHGENTICCGSGGIVSMINPDLCVARAQRRIAEFAETAADTCITSCMSCSFRLSRTDPPGKVQHCLEKVFGIPVDYGQVEENTRLMWEGSQGELNLERLAQTSRLPVEDSRTSS